MKPTLAIATAALMLVGLVGAVRSEESETTIWLSDQAIVYVSNSAQLAQSEIETDWWELEEGAIRIACHGSVSLIAGGHNVVVDDGLVTIAVESQQVATCVEEGTLTIDEHRITAGTCAELSADGRISTREPESGAVVVLSSAAIDLHPAVQDDPLLALDSTLGAIGVGSSGAAADGENVEAGASAACLDSSSSGADAVGPDTPDIVAPEVDRDGHLVHVEVTLEDF